MSFGSTEDPPKNSVLQRKRYLEASVRIEGLRPKVVTSSRPLGDEFVNYSAWSYVLFALELSWRSELGLVRLISWGFSESTF